MELTIYNTNNTAPYGIDEIMHSEPVKSLNEAQNKYEAWCEANIVGGGKLPQGRVIDGEDEYDAATGEYVSA